MSRIKFTTMIVAMMCVLSFFETAHAKSYLFRPFEVDRVREVREGGGSISSEFVQKFYMSALIYVSETNWSVWLNDQVIRPENLWSLPNVSLVKVMPEGIKIKGGNGGAVLLSAHQTYDADTGTISFGDTR